MGRVTHYDTVQMMAYLLSQRENVAKYWVTVTAGQTHTINSLGIAAGKSAVVTWGDGLSNEYTGTVARTHVYASSGTYEIKIYTPENVITFDLRDGAAVSVLNSADLKTMANISTFYLYGLPSASITLNSADWVDWRVSGNFYLYNLSNASITLNSADWVDWRVSGTVYLFGLDNASITLNSADWVDWRPSSFSLSNLPSASITLNSADWVDWRVSGNFQLSNLPSASITLNSADMVDWRPGNLSLVSLSNASITLNSADMVDWRPGNLSLFNLRNATITIAPSTIKNWSGVTELSLRAGNLTQPQCDLVLWECYQIARTRTGGTINLAAGSNAAPSGTFQPCQSSSVSATTPGKEIAYELLNDSLGLGFNKWATVSTN